MWTLLFTHSDDYFMGCCLEWKSLYIMNRAEECVEQEFHPLVSS
jgi:hypothetical protein